jgi:tetraacyldisaccharide-1-P 4'-kinase
VALRVGGTVELVAFSDHHVYTPADVARLARHAAGRPLVITEKDAVKLRAHAGTIGECYVLSEEMRWDWGEEAVLARVRAACARVEHG